MPYEGSDEEGLARPGKCLLVVYDGRNLRSKIPKRPPIGGASAKRMGASGEGTGETVTGEWALRSGLLHGAQAGLERTS